MTVQITKCDICGKIKGEANKWLSATAGIAGGGRPSIIIGSSEHCFVLDICSDTCLQKKLSEVLAQIRAESTVEA